MKINSARLRSISALALRNGRFRNICVMLGVGVRARFLAQGPGACAQFLGVLGGGTGRMRQVSRAGTGRMGQVLRAGTWRMRPGGA